MSNLYDTIEGLKRGRRTNAERMHLDKIADDLREIQANARATENGQHGSPLRLGRLAKGYYTIAHGLNAPYLSNLKKKFENTARKTMKASKREDKILQGRNPNTVSNSGNNAPLSPRALFTSPSRNRSRSRSREPETRKKNHSRRNNRIRGNNNGYNANNAKN